MDCPHCQQPPARAGFCDRCFKPLRPLEQGVIARALEATIQSAPPATPARPTSEAGLDLRKVEYVAPDWKRRYGPPLLKATGLTLALLLVVGGGIHSWKDHVKTTSARQARELLQASQQSLQGKRSEEAYRQAREALEKATQSSDRGLRLAAHQHLAEVADLEEQWSESSRHRIWALDLEPSKVSLEQRLSQLHQQRCKLGLSLLSRAREALQSRRPDRALILASGASSLLEQHQGSLQQRAEAHYVHARVYQSLEQRDEARAQARTVLELAPQHPGARQLLAALTPPPPPPADPPPVFNPPLPPPRPKSRPTKKEAPVRLGLPAPDYPTYQPPRKDEDEKKDSGVSRPRSSPSKKPRWEPRRNY